MQAKLKGAQAFATSVFQRAAEIGEIVFQLNPVSLLTSSTAPLIDLRYYVSKREPTKEPFYQLYPEALEYQAPREIVQKPLPNITYHLPDHVLLAIFEFYLYDDGEDEYRTGNTYRKPTLSANLSFSASPMTLFSVCSRWRSFYDTPSLWTSLAVYKPRTKQVPMIISWLERSVPKEPSKRKKGSSLISLYLHAPPGDEGRDQPTINFILSLFMSPSNANRMKHLTIKLAGDFPISMPAFDAPYLRSVELDFGGARDPAPIWRSICQREPRIRKVSWRPAFIGRPPLPFLMPWELLTHLKLPLVTRNVSPNVILAGLAIAFIYCENLVSLEIAITLPVKGTFLSTNHYTAEQQAESLRRLRAIRERHNVYRNYADLLTTEQHDINVSLSQPIELPRLRHLKIEAHGRDATPLLDHLIVPTLCSLDIIHCAIDGPLQPSTDGIISLLQRSKPPLTSLSLFDPQMTKAETLKLVSCPLTELRHLELHVGLVGNHIMRALTITSESHPMPKLRKLVLPECAVSNGHMAGMVMSRTHDSRFKLKELRMSLPPVMRTKPRMRTMSKEQYEELRLLKDLASNLGEEQFVLIVD